MRDYHEALAKLSELSSNRAVTSLFELPPSSSQHQQDLKTTRPSPHELNAHAIPEVLAWLRRAGYTPQDLARMRHIHVAGTKGKGSVCAYATSMLARYRRGVGTYTSPHLVSPRERIAIDGVPVGQAEFAEAFFEIWDRLTAAARAEGASPREAEGATSKPFFFRYLTIMAWHIFLKRGVRDVVMEVGIGGEFDATNVLPPEAVSAAVVTQLGVDHVAMLGDSVEEIAWHKAGIFKRGVRAFALGGPTTAAAAAAAASSSSLEGASMAAGEDSEKEKQSYQSSSVMEVLRERAAEKGAELVELDRAQIEAWGGVAGGRLRGDFQKKNQALAIAAVRQHLGLLAEGHASRNGGVGGKMGSMLRPLDDIPDKMLEGLREASLRGRCEVVQDPHAPVTWLLDGAHTTDSLAEVARWVASQLDSPSERLILLFNQQERDAGELLAGFLAAVRRATRRADVFCHGVLTRNELERLGGEEEEAQGEDGDADSGAGTGSDAGYDSGSARGGKASSMRMRDVEVQRGAAERMIHEMGEAGVTIGVSILDNVRDAVQEAVRVSGKGGGDGWRQKILVTGSFHLVGGVLRVLEPDESLA